MKNSYQRKPNIEFIVQRWEREILTPMSVSPDPISAGTVESWSCDFICLFVSRLNTSVVSLQCIELSEHVHSRRCKLSRYRTSGSAAALRFYHCLEIFNPRGKSTHNWCWHCFNSIQSRDKSGTEHVWIKTSKERNKFPALLNLSIPTSQQWNYYDGYGECSFTDLQWSLGVVSPITSLTLVYIRRGFDRYAW